MTSPSTDVWKKALERLTAVGREFQQRQWPKHEMLTQIQAFKMNSFADWMEAQMALVDRINNPDESPIRIDVNMLVTPQDRTLNYLLDEIARLQAESRLNQQASGRA